MIGRLSSRGRKVLDEFLEAMLPFPDRREPIPPFLYHYTPWYREIIEQGKLRLFPLGKDDFDAEKILPPMHGVLSEGPDGVEYGQEQRELVSRLVRDPEHASRWYVPLSGYVACLTTETDSEHHRDTYIRNVVQVKYGDRQVKRVLRRFHSHALSRALDFASRTLDETTRAALTEISFDLFIKRCLLEYVSFKEGCFMQDSEYRVCTIINDDPVSYYEISLQDIELIEEVSAKSVCSSVLLDP